MRQILTQLQGDLAQFVDDRETLAMVVECTEAEVPYVTKVLELVEAEHESDVFLLFCHDVEADDDAQSYVTKVVDNVEVQRAGVNEARAEAELPPWEVLPAACHDVRVTPSDRLIALLRWVRAQIGDLEHRIVFGLLPVQVHNHAAYAAAVRGLLPGEDDALQPWMAGCRIVLRDERRTPTLIPHLQEHPSDWVVLYEGLDLSPGSLADSLVEVTEDPTAPDEERVVALIQLAGLDYSHRRYDDAFAKWGALFEYYARAESPMMQALCLCGAADVLQATGKLVEAKQTYQQGLAYLKEPELAPSMLNLLLGIGEVCIALEHWEDAEGYLHLAEQITATRRLHAIQCDVMARRGIGLVGLGRLDEAHTLWRACADLSRAIDYGQRCTETIGHLIQLAERRGHTSQARALRAELEVQTGQGRGVSA